MRKRIIIFLFSIICITGLFAQSNNGTNISGDDVGWGDGYDLIFKVDGELYKTITLEKGAPITPEPAPTKEGYTFSGWSEIPSTMPANDVEVTGSFSINSYNLVYKVDGAEYKSLTLKYGSTITPETEPTREGYTFSGWSEIPATMPASNVEVTGSFNINSYKLVYKVDGNEYKSKTVKYGSKITAEAFPTKEGYTFSGWSEIPSTMPANDVEITGSFSINSYNLVYKVDGAEYKSLTLKYGSTITPETEPTREGYTFSGWSEMPATMPASNVEVTGSFNINSYKLVYVVDGSEYKSLTLVYGSTITLETEPTKEGYTFSGWSNIPATMPASNVEVSGSFSINLYKLVYMVDGSEYKSLTLVYGSTITLEIEPAKEGYTFSGWGVIPETMPAHNVEVTGSFMVNKYLLEVLVDDEVIYSDSIAFGTRLIDYLDLITQNGIDLTQWECYSQIDTITMPAYDVIINAVRDAVLPIFMDVDNSAIFDLTGRQIQVDNISTLPSGIYFHKGRKFIVR